jgi:Outer membrane protein beta-barrel domain
MHKRIFFGTALGLATLSTLAQAQYPAQPPPPPPPPGGYGYGAPVAPAAPRLRFGSPGELAISSDANLGLTGTTTGGVNGGPSSSGWNLTLMPAADYFVIQGLSVGGFVNFTHTEVSSPSTTPGDTASSSLSINTFGIGPRIGYNIPINDWISVWPKAGISFSDTSVSGGGSGTRWTLVLFAPFLYHLASHFFVGLGPILSADLAANESPANGNSGPAAKVVTYGLAFTVGGWFTP